MAGAPSTPIRATPLPEWTQRWAGFAADALDRYDVERDFPGTDGTSRLSPHLRFGIVHPLTRCSPSWIRTNRGHETFAKEIAWRDFYADVLHRHPRSAWENLDRRFDRIAVDTDDAARAKFELWCRGQTGFPIVDAGMRQLERLGWMHNRVRMITASFLVKDLHLPWQWGARHFMKHLVDGDLASNNHGWQWVAGSRHRCRSVLPGVQPGGADGALRPGRRVRRVLDPRARHRATIRHRSWTTPPSAGKRWHGTRRSGVDRSTIAACGDG